MKQSIYTRITHEIVADLKRGVAPWVKPWTGSADPTPHNAATGRRYRGINHLLLGMRCYALSYRTNGWLTYRQTIEVVRSHCDFIAEPEMAQVMGGNLAGLLARAGARK